MLNWKRNGFFSDLGLFEIVRAQNLRMGYPQTEGILPLLKWGNIF